MKRKLITLALSATAGVAMANPPTYTYHELPSLSGWTNWFAMSINNNLDVVGAGNVSQYSTTGTESGGVGVRWSSGTITSYFTAQGASSTCLDINDSGTIVGGSTRPNRPTVGNRFSGGFTEILNPNPTGTQAIAGHVNAQGDAVGTSKNQAASYWRAGQTNPEIIFSYSGVTESAARDINDSGEILGEDGPSSNSITREYRPWVMTSNGSGINYRLLDAPNDPDAQVYAGVAINNSGFAVGNKYLRAGGASIGTLWDTQGHLTLMPEIQPTDINDSGWIIGAGGNGAFLNQAVVRIDGTTYDFASLLTNGPGTQMGLTSINDHGDVAGFVLTSSGYRGFYATATPVPEPASIAAIGLGLAWLSRKRKQTK